MKLGLLCALSVGGFLVVAIGAVGQEGQQRPSFSGTWNSGVLDKPIATTGNANRNDSHLLVAPTFTHLTIRQDAKTVEIIEQRGEGNRNTLTYHPDGSAVKNPFPLLLGKTEVNSYGTRVAVEEKIPAQYVTKWKGNQLVSAITVEVPGEKAPRQYEETISLGADGILSIRLQRVGTGDSRTLNYKKQ